MWCLGCLMMENPIFTLVLVVAQGLVMFLPMIFISIYLNRNICCDINAQSYNKLRLVKAIVCSLSGSLAVYGFYYPVSIYLSEDTDMLLASVLYIAVFLMCYTQIFFVKLKGSGVAVVPSSFRSKVAHLHLTSPEKRVNKKVYADFRSSIEVLRVKGYKTIVLKSPLLLKNGEFRNTKLLLNDMPCTCHVHLEKVSMMSIEILFSIVCMKVRGLFKKHAMNELDLLKWGKITITLG